MMFDFFKKAASKYHRNFKREYNTSHYIPYICHWNKTTLLTKRKELIQIIKINGFSFETADDEDVDIKKDLHNLLLKGISSGSITLYYHTIRRKHSIASTEDTFDPSINLNLDFPSMLEKEWAEKRQNSRAYINELYLTIVYKSDTSGAAYIEHLIKKFRYSASGKAAWEKDVKESLEELEELTNRVLTSYRSYDAELLTVKETKGSLHSEMLEFLCKITNAGYAPEIISPNHDLSHLLSLNRLYFYNKHIEVHRPFETKYAGIVSIKEYGPTTYAGMFDGFLQMPFEFIMTQSFSYTNKQAAVAKMQLQQNRMIQAEDKAISQIHEINAALDMAMSGDIAFGEHHTTVLCIENSKKLLESAMSMSVVEFSNCGINAVIERPNLEPAYWGQLPGNSDFLVRKSIINTLNLAGFASLHNYPAGKAHGNHWGDAVTVFDTTSGTPYYFNFHVRDVGHTLIIGPTGAGKTVLMNFLCAQAQKFKCNMYFFDKDRGAEIFIRALGGEHITINPRSKCRLNPLLLPDTSSNRTYLLEWLGLLVTVHGEKLNSDDIAVLNQAINGNYKLSVKDRKLRNIIPFLGIEQSNSLASRISMWYGNGSHAGIFDNDEDSIDFTQANVFGFEMAELLKDSLSLAPVLGYLFHRINIALDGTPTMIVLDEAWALIDNPIFAPKIKDWLKVLRKLNTFVIFATQSVEDASKSTISDTLIQQTATQIFLPNLKATNVYRTSFMLSEREYILIKTTDPSSRFFLVKQGNNAVVARINLSGMDDIINILSGRTSTVLMLDEVRKQVGDDPADWLPIFYQKARQKDE